MLIGYFGVVPEEPHSLRELLALYKRPSFVAIAMLYLLVMVSMLIMAHLTEWQLLWQPATAPQQRQRRRWRNFARRRRSAPALATVTEVSENSSGFSTQQLPALNEERAQLLDEALTSNSDAGKRTHGTLAAASDPHKPSYGTIPLGRGRPSHRSTPTQPPLVGPDVEAAAPPRSALLLPENRPTVLALAVAYSATSGTLSGICLLLAKSGVDLLLLTLRGNNQLTSPLSWVLVTILFAAALLQLWYLNKSLKLADPVLVCPLAFCFYNISSITLGLVYFNELERLSAIDVLCVCVGTVLLLCGVWVISLHDSTETEEELDNGSDITVWGPGWHDPVAWHAHDTSAHDPSPQNAEAQHAHEATRGQAPSGSASWTPYELAQHTPLAPHLQSRQGRSTSLPLPSHRPNISLDHALNEGARTRDRTHAKSARHPTLYGILVERGLSIGLSPSSPGFHVAPRRTSSATHSSPNSPKNQRHLIHDTDQ